MTLYKTKPTQKFAKRYSKLTRRNPTLAKLIKEKTKKLQKDPFDSSLRTHKVENVWSSSVTGDLRILWIFTDNQIVILLLTIGGHSGKHKVY